MHHHLYLLQSIYCIYTYTYTQPTPIQFALSLSPLGSLFSCTVICIFFSSSVIFNLSLSYLLFLCLFICGVDILSIFSSSIYKCFSFHLSLYRSLLYSTLSCCLTMSLFTLCHHLSFYSLYLYHSYFSCVIFLSSSIPYCLACDRSFFSLLSLLSFYIALSFMRYPSFLLFPYYFSLDLSLFPPLSLLSFSSSAFLSFSSFTLSLSLALSFFPSYPSSFSPLYLSLIFFPSLFLSGSIFLSSSSPPSLSISVIVSNNYDYRRERCKTFAAYSLALTLI